MNKIGIIGAMELEVSALCEEIKKSGNYKETEFCSLTFYEGSINGTEVVVVKSGIGKVNASICAQILILKFGVTAVINSGVGGAMGGGLSIFDVAVSTDAVYHDMDVTNFGYKPTEIPQMNTSVFKADEKLIQLAVKGFNNANACAGKKIVAGRIATGDQFICSNEVKNKIKTICSPICCEMEGAAIAHTCYLNNIPFVILRCVSDNADDYVDTKNIYKSTTYNEATAAKQCSSIVIEMLKDLK